jgi:spore coat protein U-like protein
MRRVEEMKKLALTLFAVSLVLTFAGRSMAADTADIQVSAEVVGSCTMAQLTDMDFGALPDPAVFPYSAVTLGQVDVTCPVAVAFTVDEVSGANDASCTGGPHCVGLAAFYIDYATTNLPQLGVGIGMGVGNEVTVNIDGDITMDYSLAPVGVYTDTLTLNVNP